MNMENFFDILGGEPARVLARFGGNEALWLRFAIKFRDDKTYGLLQTSVNEDDGDGIETHAHTLKGVSANLGFDNLSTASAAVVNAVRGGEREKIPELFDLVTTEYEKVLKCMDVLNQQ